MNELPIDIRLAVDLVLIAMIVEMAVLAVWSRRFGSGVRPTDLIFNLLAGACLVLALRVAISDLWPGWAALCLLGSLAAHLMDLRRRWRIG